jgi:ADP-ribosylglycohydrolase
MRNLPPSGYVRDTLHHALVSFIRTDSFADCLIRAVNLGGDADTIGAVAGGLAGVYYGFDAIPTEWVETLEPAIRAELEELSERLAAVGK